MVDGISIGGIPDPWRAGRAGSGASIRLITTNDGEGVLKRALSRVKSDEGGDAHFRFGKASRFSVVTPDKSTNPGVNVTWPDDGNQDDEPKEVHIIEYDEVSRCWETIRVENPDDPEQYVMVRNTLRVVFVGRDDGLYRAFNLAKANEYK